MKASEIPFLSRELISIDSIKGGTFKVGHFIDMFHPLDNESLLQLQQGESRQATVAFNSRLMPPVARHDLNWWIVKANAKSRLDLKAVHFSLSALFLSKSLRVLYDRKIQEEVELEAPNSRTDLHHWLQEEFLIEVNSRSWILAAYVSDLEAEGPAQDKAGFQMFGRQFVITLIRQQSGWLIKSLTRHNNKEPDQLRAIDAPAVEWYDEITALNLSPEKQAELDHSIGSNGEYLKLWEEYSAIELNLAQERHQKLGHLQVKAIIKTSEENRRTILLIPSVLERYNEFRTKYRTIGLLETEWMELGEDIPSFGESLDQIVSPKNIGLLSGQTNHKKVHSWIGGIRLEDNHLIFQSSRDQLDLPEDKELYLYLSLVGDQTINTRRKQANNLIQNHHYLPQLQMLLQGISVVDTHRPSKLTNQLIQKIPRRLNQKQKDAVQLALSTTDIALIIGPPGTGKTEVISVILTLLNQQEQYQEGIKRTLVSSFQHDAVDNALSRTRVLGLPGLKSGRRSDDKDQEESGLTRELQQWCQEYGAQIHKKIEQIYQAEPILVVHDRYVDALIQIRYGSGHFVDSCEKVDQSLQQLASDFGLQLMPMLAREWEEFKIQKIQTAPIKSRVGAEQILVQVRRLRTTVNSFSDDGTIQAARLLRGVQRQKLPVTNADLADLEAAAWMDDGDVPSEVLFERLARLQARLLDKLCVRPLILNQSRHLNSDDYLLIDRMSDTFQTRLKSGPASRSYILKSYLNQMDSNAQRLVRTIQNYTTVVGSTCQQSARLQTMEMLTQQSLSTGNALRAGIADVVIIDEAARANPLDMFIPMCMAKERVILVGDHRQLPQLLDPDVESKLKSTYAESYKERESKAYQQSLFERLYLHLQTLEKETGVKRIVMLDQQYRMHPALGKLISDEFYDKAGVGQVYSPRPASDFHHHLTQFYERGQPCHAYWYDVPKHEGHMGRLGTSRIRVAEAQRCAEIAADILKVDSEISVGIITFYSAQTRQLMQALEPYGLYKRDDQNKLKLNMTLNAKGEERLCVGTVDSFQGKEFDVVLLSVVRTIDDAKRQSLQQITPDSKDYEEVLNSAFGHLRSSNRMNVAMSRQRKLLIVVGDRGLIHEEGAAVAIPALQRFDALCRRQGL